jgi:hypothetical protein
MPNAADAPQFRAHPGVRGLSSSEIAREAPSAVAETRAALLEIDEEHLVRLMLAYFADLHLVLGECARVLRPGGIAWMVMGGARLKGVYVPSDLIAAEMAEQCGFHVRELRVARDLIDVGRKLGRMGNVAPRETVIVLERE